MAQRRGTPAAGALLGGALRVRADLHQAVFRASRGRLLRTWGGLPVVVLTTTGRRTGKPRTTVLVSPARVGDALVVVASAGGAPAHPDWYLNLRARPDVVLMTAGGRTSARARVAGPEEAARLRAAVEERSPAYARYRARTSRTIPLVVLEPTPGPTPGRAGS